MAHGIVATNMPILHPAITHILMAVTQCSLSEVDSNTLERSVSSFSGQQARSATNARYSGTSHRKHVNTATPQVLAEISLRKFHFKLIYRNVIKVSFQTALLYFTEETLFRLFCKGNTIYLN